MATESKTEEETEEITVETVQQNIKNGTYSIVSKPCITAKSSQVWETFGVPAETKLNDKGEQKLYVVKGFAVKHFTLKFNN